MRTLKLPKIQPNKKHEKKYDKWFEFGVVDEYCLLQWFCGDCIKINQLRHVRSKLFDLKRIDYANSCYSWSTGLTVVKNRLFTEYQEKLNKDGSYGKENNVRCPY